MPRVRDLLQRFRPLGTPGAATAAVGVPVDRELRLADELEPALAQLARTERECDDLLVAARREAAQIRRADAQHVAAVLASARARADAQRTAAANRVQRTSTHEAAERLVAAQREVAAIQDHAGQLMPQYVERAAANLRRALP